MNLIFLDIDGVLNSVDSAVAHHALHPKHHREEFRLDPISVGLLKLLCEITDAKIVISSMWRLSRQTGEFHDIFAHYGWIAAPVISRTPNLGTQRGY